MSFYILDNENNPVEVSLQKYAVWAAENRGRNRVAETRLKILDTKTIKNQTHESK